MIFFNDWLHFALFGASCQHSWQRDQRTQQQNFFHIIPHILLMGQVPLPHHIFTTASLRYLSSFQRIQQVT